MDNENTYQSYISHQPGGRNRKLWVIGGLVVVVLVIIGLVVAGSRKSVTQSPDPGYSLQSTDVSSTQNFSHIGGDDLYTYNGAAFTKTSLSDGKPTVLADGIKLPTPDTVTWADSQGVLLSFKQSFARSLVDDYFTAQGTSMYDQGDLTTFVWYFNFADKSFKQVGNIPIKGTSAVYSAPQKRFYYIGDTTRFTVPTTKVPLFTYDLASGKLATVVDDTRLVSTRSMSACTTSQTVCIIGRTANDQQSDRLYTATNDHAMKQLFSSKGRLFGTSDPDRFIAAPRDQASDDEPSNESSSNRTTPKVDYGAEVASLYDAKNNGSTSLGFTLGEMDVFVHLNKDNTYFAFDQDYHTDAKNPDSPTAYRSGTVPTDGDKPSTGLFAMKYADGKDFSDRVLTVVDGSSSSLLTTVNGKELLFSNTQNAQGSTGLKAVDAAAAQKAVKTCTDATKTSSDYTDHQFKVYVLDNAAFSQNIKKFGDCLTGQSSAPLIGYYYQFAAVDPFNGRLTSD